MDLIFESVPMAYSKWGHAPWGAGIGAATASFLQSFRNVF